jgi:hypothetical protein
VAGLAAIFSTGKPDLKPLFEAAQSRAAPWPEITRIWRVKAGLPWRRTFIGGGR